MGSDLEIKVLRDLEKACRRWFAADDGSLKALNDETKAQMRMFRCLKNLDKIRQRGKRG